MEIDVKVFINLRENRNSKAIVEEDSMAVELLESLGIPISDVGILLINDKQALLDQRLQNGDKVIVIPPTGGG